VREERYAAQAVIDELAELVTGLIDATPQNGIVHDVNQSTSRREKTNSIKMISTALDRSQIGTAFAVVSGA